MRHLVVAVLVSVAVLAAACGAEKKENHLVVATEAAYPPFESVDKQGTIVGFDIDLVRAVAEGAGYTVEFVDQPFDGLIPGLRQGRFDAAVSAMTITEARAKQVLFTDGYYDAGQVIAVRDDNEKIKELKDLEGGVIAVQLGTTGHLQADEVKGATVKTFPSVEPAFLELLAGRCDAVINDDPTTLLYMREHEGLRIVGEPFTSEQYGIALPLESTNLRDKLNAALQALRDSGEYDRIKKQWIGGE